MKVNIDDFKMKEGKACVLGQLPTLIESRYASKQHYHRKLEKQISKMRKLQRLLYASNQHSVLLIFQAMDAAGKDGAIRHVMSGINPQGCQVTSFKHPTATELDHDFMWRTNQAMPERGRIGIFNRSYYEDVLIVKVHPEILSSQRVPERIGNVNDMWQQRYQSILDSEEHLSRNGTRIVKIFLHLSRDQQRLRFLKRIDKPSKNWKFSEADISERQYWNKYMQAYQDCISATSTEKAPWYLVPADDKKNARLIVANIIVETLQSLDMHYPASDEQRIKELQRYRRELT